MADCQFRLYTASSHSPARDCLRCAATYLGQDQDVVGGDGVLGALDGGLECTAAHRYEDVLRLHVQGVDIQFDEIASQFLTRVP